MKLRECLREGQKYKIGSNFGYFFCGRWTKDGSLKMATLSAKYYADLVAVYKLEKKSVEKAEELKKKAKLTPSEEGAIRNAKKTAKRLAGRKKAVDNFIPFMARQVIDTYPSILEKDCEIVLLDGEERGPYWTVEEAENAVV